jgi:hypothetical protein
MPTEVILPRISEEKAYAALTTALCRSPKAGVKVALADIIEKEILRHKPPNAGSYTWKTFQPNAAPFYSAVWRLCMHGVLAQAPEVIYRDYEGVAGGHFVITEYGEKWLSGLSDYDCVPTEYGRFSQLLSTHAKRLGDGYHVRSQEAVSCYRAQTYLACCAMCGAAAESIMLALAITKKGDEEAILKDYGSSGGRGRIERLLMMGKDANIIKNLPNYTSLLKDWRDVAAHGDAPIVGEEEAFTALMLLLRFARFADERWADITSS